MEIFCHSRRELLRFSTSLISSLAPFNVSKCNENLGNILFNRILNGSFRKSFLLSFIHVFSVMALGFDSLTTERESKLFMQQKQLNFILTSRSASSSLASYIILLSQSNNSISSSQWRWNWIMGEKGNKGIQQTERERYDEPIKPLNFFVSWRFV